MKNQFNTIALAYTNDKGEIVAWSADTFGSPREYPKTYKDCQENRDMLKKKFDKTRSFGHEVAKVLAMRNPGGASIIEQSLAGDEESFKEITGFAIVKLNLVTNYDRAIDTPKWPEVVACIDNKEYQIVKKS